MAAYIVSSNDNPRLRALKEKKEVLSSQIDEARKSLSTTDFFLQQLKKQKLVIKDCIYELESQAASSA